MKLTLIEKDGTMLTCSVNLYGITGDCYEYPKGSDLGIPVAVSLAELIKRSKEAEEVDIPLRDYLLEHVGVSENTVGALIKVWKPK